MIMVTKMLAISITKMSKDTPMTLRDPMTMIMTNLRRVGWRENKMKMRMKRRRMRLVRNHRITMRSYRKKLCPTYPIHEELHRHL